MRAVILFFNSSVGKKLLMAVTGLALVGFLLGHLAGNFLLFAGPDVYNGYGHALVSNPLIYVAEAGLIVLFLGHACNAIMITLRNRAARRTGYAMRKTLGESTVASTTMLISGICVAIFLVIHIVSIKYGPNYPEKKENAPEFAEVTAAAVQGHDAHGVARRDLHDLVQTLFKKPLYSTFYMLSMIVMGLHLMHAMHSAVKTFGFSQPGYLRLVERGSAVLAVLIAGGFALFPFYYLFIAK